MILHLYIPTEKDFHNISENTFFGGGKIRVSESFKAYKSLPNTKKTVNVVERGKLLRKSKEFLYKECQQTAQASLSLLFKNNMNLVR